MLLTHEDGQRLHIRRGILPLCVGLCDVAFEDAKLRAIVFEHHWQMRRANSSPPLSVTTVASGCARISA